MHSCGVSRKIVHLESEGLHERGLCAPTLEDAKQLCGTQDQFVLELDREGRGRIVWLFPDQEETLGPRFKVWRSCYGGWPHWTMYRKES